MSDDETCGVCIDSDVDGDEMPSFQSDEWVKARKDHKCCECRKVIAVGERYERSTGKWDGRVKTYKTCAACQDIRQSLCCNGWRYGSLWEDAEEQLLPHMTTACLMKLATAVGKQKLLDEWNRWKFERSA